MNPTHTAITVGASSTAVVAVNKRRRYLLLQNDSDAVLYVKLGGTAEMNAGMRIPIGGSLEFSPKSGNLFLGPIAAISQAGSKRLLVTEA